MKCINFHNKQLKISCTQKLCLMNKEIACSKSTKFPGVTIDEELN